MLCVVHPVGLHFVMKIANSNSDDEQTSNFCGHSYHTYIKKCFRGKKLKVRLSITGSQKLGFMYYFIAATIMVFNNVETV